MYYYLEGENNPETPRIALSETLSEPFYKQGQPTFLMLDPSEADKGKRIGDLFQAKSFLISGLSVKFAKLNTDQKILQFANEHGFLGVKTSPWRGEFDYYFLKNFKYEEKGTIVEPIEEWYWHINHINKLIKLYKNLKDNRDLEDILYVDQRGQFYPPPLKIKTINQKLPPGFGQFDIPTPTEYNEEKTEGKYHFYWCEDNTPTLLSYDEQQDTNYKCAAMRILLKHPLTFLERGIFIDFSAIKIDKTLPLGFGVQDRKATPYLLAAIYYDVWRMINNMEPVEVCKACKNPFTPKRSDAMYCGKTCQKRQERQDKKSAQ